MVAAAWAALGGVDIVLIAQGELGDQLATEADFPAAEAILRTHQNKSISSLFDVDKDKA